MGSILLDSSQAPLYTFVVQGDPTFAQLSDHLRDYRGLLERGRPFTLLFDGRNAGMLDAKSRKAYADFVLTNANDLRLFCKGGAIVVTSSLTMGVMTAVLWLAPLPFPHRTFTSVEDANKWLRTLL